MPELKCLHRDRSKGTVQSALARSNLRVIRLERISQKDQVQ